MGGDVDGECFAAVLIAWEGSFWGGKGTGGEVGISEDLAFVSFILPLQLMKATVLTESYTFYLLSS